MEKQVAQDILTNAMGSLFAEAEIETGIAEAASISREEYNRVIENGLELPECIKKYRESNRKRKMYEEKLLKAEVNEQLLQDAESTNEPPPAIQSMIGITIKNTKDENGKYLPENGQRDRNIIQWIFNNSGYADEITPELYYKHVSTKSKQSTIERYFSDAKNEAELESIKNKKSV